jgi:hypothetical protein
VTLPRFFKSKIGPLRRLALQEAQLRELTERVRLQDELPEAAVNALATMCEQLPGDAPQVAAKLHDLMFDRKKRPSIGHRRYAAGENTSRWSLAIGARSGFRIKPIRKYSVRSVRREDFRG